MPPALERGCCRCPDWRVIDDEVIERPFNKQQLLRLFSYLKPYKWSVAVACVLMVIAAVASLALPYLMSIAVDDITAGNLERFPVLIVSMVVVALASALCIRYRARILDTAGRKAIGGPSPAPVQTMCRT